MSRRWLGTRMAPAALAIVSGLVVVGFLQVDRQMVRAERDHAALMVSETARALEVFLLRRAACVAEIAGNLRASGTVDSTNVRATIGSSVSEWGRQFDSLWIIGSSGTLTLATRLERQTGQAQFVMVRSSTEDSSLSAFARMVRSSQRRRPFMGFVRMNGHGMLAFGQALSPGRDEVVIGGLVVDTLLNSVRQRVRWDGSLARVEIMYGTDTIVRLAAGVVRDHFRSVDARLDVPGGRTWIVRIAYPPSGRGVRIALWVIGLGALMGLAIGLVLERREASRIADRSSELEHLSAELLRANRAKSEFLANVSHELRTPLNAIVGFVDLLRDGVYGTLNPRQVGPVQRIEASANHLRHLVDQVLDLAKIAAGRLEVHTEPVELRPFVFDVASEVEPLITEKGLTFSLGVGGSLPRVRTDPTHLRQILINLLGNAVKFTNQGGISVRARLVGATTEGDGRVYTPADRTPPTLSLRADQLWVALQVADSGIGIPDKDRERIFDEFEQVNAGPRGDSMKRGTGLGLSISRRLARLLGGDISVESQVGRGSVFTVWLPVDPADLREGRAA